MTSTLKMWRSERCFGMPVSGRTGLVSLGAYALLSIRPAFDAAQPQHEALEAHF